MATTCRKCGGTVRAVGVTWEEAKRREHAAHFVHATAHHFPLLALGAGLFTIARIAAHRIFATEFRCEKCGALA